MPPKPFPQDIAWSLHPSGGFLSFDSDALQVRIYQDTGHIEIAGPDLAGNPLSGVVTFAPPAVRTANASSTIGAVTAHEAIPDGLELTQKLGNGLITSQLRVVQPSVARYEVVDWAGIAPIATAIAASSDQKEHFYGFGEKFNSFDQAGKRVEILSFDEPGLKNDRSYKVSPWFVSTRGYGLHLDSSAESSFDMRAKAKDRYVITNQFSGLQFNVVWGPTLPDILTRFTGYAGRPTLPPPWAFGVWISSDIWRSGGEVRYAVTQFRERDLPASAFVFDSPWEVAYNDFKFNLTQFAKDDTIDGRHYPGFSSLNEMMTFFQSNGLKVICWMTPLINTESVNENVAGQNLGKSANYDDAANQGLFVGESQGGGPLVVPWWKGRGSPVDFTNPAARQWLTDQLQKLVEDSRVTTASNESEPAIGGFKTDDGESGNGANTYIPKTAQYADGRTGVEMRNAYCFEYHKAVASVLGKDGILFARSGFIGSQAFPSSWAGDNEPNFGDNGLPSVIIAGQSAAMSGYAIWGHDTGGYQDTNFSVSPSNLFMRWAQFGCFSPIMQMHRQVAKELQYPWRYGEDALNNFRIFAKFHTRLFPYIYTYAKQANTTGLPIIRPLVLTNQTDENTYALQHTYLFGNEFLVAPVITPNSKTRQLYLPQGNWIDFWTNAKKTGGHVITWTNANQSQFPLFVREGAIVPMLLNDPQTLCDSNYVNSPTTKTADSGLSFHVYPGGMSRFTVHDGTDLQSQAGPAGITLTLTSKARMIGLQILGKEPDGIMKDDIAIQNVPNATEFETADSGWRFDSQAGLIFVKFHHDEGTTTLHL